MMEGRLQKHLPPMNKMRQVKQRFSHIPMEEDKRERCACRRGRSDHKMKLNSRLKDQAGKTYHKCQEQINIPKNPTTILLSLMGRGQEGALHVQAWHSAKLALISAVVYVPSAVCMILVGYSAKRFRERNLHCTVPLLIGGVFFMYAPCCHFQLGLHIRQEIRHISTYVTHTRGYMPYVYGHMT